MSCNHEFIGMSTGVVCKPCQMKNLCVLPRRDERFFV